MTNQLKTMITDYKNQGDQVDEVLFRQVMQMINDNERLQNENKRLVDSLDFTVREVEQYESKMNQLEKEGIPNARG